MQTVTIKGQVVIPVALRRKYGIRKGTRVRVVEDNGHIAVLPMTREARRRALQRLVGAFEGLPLVQDLAAERKRDLERQDGHWLPGVR